MITWTKVLTVGPAFEPITLDEVKDTSIIEADGDDARLVGLIITARQYFEEKLGIALVRQTWELRLDRFPGCEIGLLRPPCASVSTVQYTDSAGVVQTLANTEYSVFATARPVAFLRPAYSKAWPATRAVPQAVIVTYLAGAASRGAVPELIRQQLRAAVAAMNENRETSVEQLLAPMVVDLRPLFGCEWEPEYQ